MRILQVAHGFPPFDLAGAEIFAYGLSLELKQRGHDIEIFHPRRDPALDDLLVESARVDGLEVTRINRREALGSFEDTYLSSAVRSAFATVLDRFRPDVIEIHHLAGLSVDIVEEAWERSIPVVFTLHDFWLICQRGQFLKPDLSLCEGQEDGRCAECFAGVLGSGGAARTARSLDRLLPRGRGAGWAGRLRRLLGPLGRAVVGRNSGARREVGERMDLVRRSCDRVQCFIAPSRYILERHLELGIPRDRMVYRRHGFDVRGYEHPRREPDGEVRFGFLGSWIPPKGVHVVFDAFEQLQDDRASLHVYGRGLPYDGDESYADALRSRPAGKGLVLHGAFDNERVGEVLAGLDVLVFPSIWFENSPLTLEEAGLAGVPVIASDLGAIPELVEEGVNGLLFRPRDAADLCAKMRRILGEEGLLDRLRKGARRQAKSLADCAAEREEVYLEVVGERRA